MSMWLSLSLSVFVVVSCRVFFQVRHGSGPAVETATEADHHHYEG